MNNKLAAAILVISACSHTHSAPFDEGNAVLFAYDITDDDTYFIDLGITGQGLVDGATIDLTDAGLQAWLTSNVGAQWTVIASVNDPSVVAGPPANNPSYINRGFVSSSYSGKTVSNDGVVNEQQRITMNSWLTQVASAANGITSFAVNGVSTSSASAARNASFFSDSLIAIGTPASLYYSQSAPDDFANLTDPVVVTPLITGVLNSNGRLLLQAGLCSDGDNDGVCNSSDNCPNALNFGQLDNDGDSMGDACDLDADGDGYNGDGTGGSANDVDDLDSTIATDADNDGVDDIGGGTFNPSLGGAPDNCPSIANTDQADLDGDLSGDECDEDIDGDGVLNGQDLFPNDPLIAGDRDGDGLDTLVETNTGIFISSSDTGTDPDVFDSDGDGFGDGAEVNITLTNPNDISSSPIEKKLTASDGTADGQFGSSVSIFGDTVVIGAQGDRSFAGAAYVYVLNNGVWAEQQKLSASDSPSSQGFGNSVSISGDTALIGTFQGRAAYVYIRNQGVWSEQQKLTDSTGESAESFGWSVSISGDTALVGAFSDLENGPFSGSAFVYIRNQGVWSEQQKLIASDGTTGDQFGWSVSISGDTAVIGAKNDDGVGTSSGSAYVYARNNNVWSEQQKLVASDGAANDFFGGSVAIADTTAVVGAFGDDDNGASSGSAYVFIHSNSAWSEQQKLTASDGAADDYFGSSVSISNDKAVIGAYGDDDNGSSSGSAYEYTFNNGVWSEQQKLTASDGAADDYFGASTSIGASVAVSNNTAVIGASGDNDNNASNSGSVYVFDIYASAPSVISGDLNATISRGGFAVGTISASDADGLTDGSYFTITIDPVYGQALVNPSNGTWTYLADAFYVGEDPFTITITDDLGGATGQIINISLQAIDTDSDTHDDQFDNCPQTPNVDQSNIDNDALGDACDDDIDGDTVLNVNDDFPYDPLETMDTDADLVGDNSDNCVNDQNMDQSNIDGDANGDVCDEDMDGDGVANIIELRFNGNQTDPSDASTSLNNVATYAANAGTDSDYDGINDVIEMAVNTNPNNPSDGPQAELNVLEMLTIKKNVPAMNGMGIILLALSLFGLGVINARKNKR